MTQDAAAPGAGHRGARRERDRVAQAYLGAMDSGPAEERLRRRIDWVTERVLGPRVLDVGCGDGILELLLARRGVSVTGVDADAEAIELARELIAGEPDEVRELVDLVEGDFAGPGPVEGRFDTVILGGGFGCVSDPAAMLDRCLSHLEPDGRVVITASLGMGPGEDPRPPLRPSDMIDLLRPRFALDVMEVQEGHIRFAGRASEDPEPSWDRMDPQAVLSMTEAALREAQIRSHELERQADLDRVTLSQHKIAAAQFKKGLDARSGEVRVLRHRLQATQSSTSFRAGSALVRAAKQPAALFKLPFELLRLYRSASSRQPEPADDDGPGGRYGSIPKELGLDTEQFVSFPPFPIPKAVVKGPKVAAILDTFTEHSFRYEADLLLLSREGWRAEMEGARPAFLFVESAFSGNDRQWRHLVAGYEGQADIRCASCWSTAAPRGWPPCSGTRRTRRTSTTSSEPRGSSTSSLRPMRTAFRCTGKHWDTTGYTSLPFAAQPRLHNPSREEGWTSHPVCFAGSWIEYRFPEREEALRDLLDPALPLDLHIFDRNLTRTDLGEYYRFPDRYKKAIKGTLGYEEMLTAYRCYDVMLNVNTIPDSPTMFSRRVFESLACGTPVVSSDSPGMRGMLGEHVRVARSAEETTAHLVDLLGDEEARLREGHLAYRHVHEDHTYRHRMAEVFRRVGIEPPAPAQPSVSVLMPTMRPENVARCLENFSKQTYAQKELVLILNNAEFDLDAVRRHAGAIPNVQVLHVEDPTTLGECLNMGVEAASGDYVAKMDDDDLYGERYLSDAVLAALFSDAEVVGKGAFFTYFEESDTLALAEVTRDHTFSYFVTGGTLLIRTDAARTNPFDTVSVREDTNFLHAAVQAGCRIYSADRYNFVRVRGRSLSDHADQTPDVEFLRKCRDREQGLDLGRVMI